MNNSQEFDNIIIKNKDNKYLVDEFIKYYLFIYSNYTNSDKTSKENYYKLLTIKKIINIIANFKQTIISGSQFESIKGIGDKTIARINEIIDTGHLSEIVENKFQIQAVNELSNIYGIGPSKASYFYETFNIKSINDLINADKKGIVQLTNQMKLGIKYKDILSTKIPRILIQHLQNFIQNLLYDFDKDFISIICGSFRREKDFSSDVDILITHKKLKNKNNSSTYLNKVIHIFSKYFIIDYLTEHFNTHFQGFASFKNIPDLPSSYDKLIFDTIINVFRIDIIIVPEQSFYTALLHFTGSGIFNQKLRLHAKSLNMKLSEYSLTILENNKKKNLKINSENDIFKFLLLKYVPPDKR